MIKGHQMGDYPGVPRVIIRVLMNEAGVSELYKETEAITLLALKMQRGVMSQEKYSPTYDP